MASKETLAAQAAHINYLRLLEQVRLFAANDETLDTDLYDECWEAGITDEEINRIYNQDLDGRY